MTVRRKSRADRYGGIHTVRVKAFEFMMLLSASFKQKDLSQGWEIIQLPKCLSRMRTQVQPLAPRKEMQVWWCMSVAPLPGRGRGVSGAFWKLVSHSVSSGLSEKPYLKK